MVKLFPLAVLVGLASAASACSDEQCPPIGYVDSFDITVADTVTGAPVCNADVRIQGAQLDYVIKGDGDSGEVPIQADGRCHYIGRQGELNREHTVTVTAPGYEVFGTKVFLKAGRCGPSESLRVDARLEKE